MAKFRFRFLICFSFLAAAIVLALGALRAESFFDPEIIETAAKSQPVKQVYLGGQSVGLSVKSDGVIVLAIAEIDTAYGRVRPKTGVEAGDIIIELNGQRILYISDITDVMRDYDAAKASAELRVLRGGKEQKVISFPIIEQYTEYYKLGLEVKEYAEGVGTVSFITPAGEFGSLGHPINSGDGKLVIPCYGGGIYACKIVGCNRGKKGDPGDLRGVFLTAGGEIGSIRKNTRFGVYGTLANIPQNAELVEVAPRSAVKPGKAQIAATVKDAPERFDIEIIKASAQGSPGEKGMVLRVTDKRLLELTGGIVQGMSGSPILQDGKLIGAVTHVFVSDPTKGYGVYMDWML